MQFCAGLTKFKAQGKRTAEEGEAERSAQRSVLLSC